MTTSTASLSLALWQVPKVLDVMTSYGTRRVAEIIGLSEKHIRAFVRADLLAPTRGPGNQYRFTFQDIALLRTARELLEGDVPARRVCAALRSLRAQLPRGRPLTAVRLAARGDRVVVLDADDLWEPETGQMALDLSLGPAAGEVAERAQPVATARAASEEQGRTLTADDWFDRGVDLEAVSLPMARSAYVKAIALDPRHAEAHVNLGRLLHRARELAAAESHYRQACAASPKSALAAFNLGVALEDRGDAARAMAAYKRAVELDPEHGEAHFNLGRLYESSGDASAALRHFSEYKRIRDRWLG